MAGVVYTILLTRQQYHYSHYKIYALVLMLIGNIFNFYLKNHPPDVYN